MTPQRPRICLVAPEFIGPFPNGGVGTACYWEAATLAVAGFDVTVLYTGPTDRQTPEHWERTYGDGAFTYVDLWKWAADGHADAVERADHPCAEARTSELVFRYLRTRRFDLLLFQEFLGHGARTLQARRSGEALSGVPAVVTLHSCRQWIYEGMQRMRVSRADMYVDFLERESARLADFVIAPSRHMSEWASTHWPLVPHASVVPYCYDPSIETPAAEVEHAGPFRHLVFFGRLETRKGLHLFCRALASSRAARGPARKVTFLGKRSTVEGCPSEEFIRQTFAAVPDLEIQIIDTLDSFEALAWIDRQKQTLVVAPSLVDNLPYAVIELFTRRIPFISTRVGGIPEIVGAANAHLLAETTVDGVAEVLSRVHQSGSLHTNYRDGYSSLGASTAHVDHVRSMLKWRPEVEAVEAESCDIVMIDAGESSLDAIRHTFLTSDPTAYAARFLTWDVWRSGSDAARPAIFTVKAVAPIAGMVRRLLNSLIDTRVDAATSYYATPASAGLVEVAPLGASLECGWAQNVFGGPCLIVRPSAFETLRHAAPQSFDFWAVNAALACAGRDIALVPDVLYETDGSEGVATAGTLDAVTRGYQAHGASRIDLGWVLKHARSGSRLDTGDTTASGGRAFYEHLLAIPTDQLTAYCGLTAEVEDPVMIDLRRLRRRLAEVVARWSTSSPRVFVYGAGEHARVMLALEPELGRFIGGFIDRRPLAGFLGRPCVRPEDMTASMADVVLYSSREFERDMQARLATLPVEHVLLYSPSPPAQEETTATRLRRRLGHRDAPVDRLRAMYRPPAWATGFISGGDTEFLLELVMGTAPQAVLELGVASGASSAALLFAMDQLPAPRSPRHLLSCDVRPSCYFDAQRPTGSAVDDMYPAYRSTWTLDTSTDARRLAQSLPPHSFDLLFIDANHSHPWPLLDLLHLALVARPGAWVALHDIDLPQVNPKYQVFGPQWLFDAWSFNKVHGVGTSRNIGAVQLPDDLRQLVPMAIDLLARPWQHPPTEWDVDLPDVFRQVTAALDGRLPRPLQAVAR
jgi:glycosyltransferase involved in cell wall biosynthesis/predicted O-methyltransferase YrrM